MSEASSVLAYIVMALTGMAVTAYGVMVYIVMARKGEETVQRSPFSSGLESDGLHSVYNRFGLYGLWSYGLYSYGSKSRSS